jgi:hypothetical protein
MSLWTVLLTTYKTIQCHTLDRPHLSSWLLWNLRSQTWYFHFVFLSWLSCYGCRSDLLVEGVGPLTCSISIWVHLSILSWVFLFVFVFQVCNLIECLEVYFLFILKSVEYRSGVGADVLVFGVMWFLKKHQDNTSIILNAWKPHISLRSGVFIWYFIFRYTS